MSSLRWTARKARALASLVLALTCLVCASGDARANDPPNAFGAVTGESDSAADVVPVTGAMAHSFNFDLPENRGSAQPALGLSYTSGARSEAAGWGWSLNLPTIERAPLSGWPKYKDNGVPEEEDRYVYNGAPLTFVCVVGSCPTDEAAGSTPSSGLFPTTGARYYRRQVDGGFERFYLSQDRKRWVVQRRGGEILELGIPVTRIDLQPTDATDIDLATGKIFRWNLAVQRDLHGANNVVIYQWQNEGAGARKLLRNIYYVPPTSATTTAGASAFAYHVELKWEWHSFRQEDRAFADKRPFAKRLRRVAISSKTWGNAGNRELVRAYNLVYFANRSIPGAGTEAPFWGRSVLRSVVTEGRCATAVPESNEQLPDPTGCPSLPATTFGYQHFAMGSGTAARFDLPGMNYVANVAIIDADHDGRPDILESCHEAHPRRLRHTPHRQRALQRDHGQLHRALGERARLPRRRRARLLRSRGGAAASGDDPDPRLSLHRRPSRLDRVHPRQGLRRGRRARAASGVRQGRERLPARPLGHEPRRVQVHEQGGRHRGRRDLLRRPFL